MSSLKLVIKQYNEKPEQRFLISFIPTLHILKFKGNKYKNVNQFVWLKNLVTNLVI